MTEEANDAEWKRVGNFHGKHETMKFSPWDILSEYDYIVLFVYFNKVEKWFKSREFSSSSLNAVLLEEGFFSFLHPQ